MRASLHFAGWAQGPTLLLTVPPSADLTVNITWFAAPHTALRSGGGRERGWRGELQAGVIGKDDGRLLKARGESKLSRREVLGAAGVAEGNSAIQDLDVEAGIQ